MDTPSTDADVAPETLLAPAKLTLSLRVTGRRDDGYHLIDAEMVSLDLHDRLEIAAGDSLTVVGPHGTETVGPDEDNLVRRALALAVGSRSGKTSASVAIAQCEAVEVGSGLS